MTEEQEVILQEAIAKGYGPGAVVDSLGGSLGHTITQESHKWYFLDGINFVNGTSGLLLRTCGNCIIYNAGKWASILNKPVNNNYPIY